MPMAYRRRTTDKRFQLNVLALRVGRIMVAESSRGHWTYDIARRMRVGRATAYGVLKQFERQGWVRNYSAPGDKKTPRVVYLLTDDGLHAITDALMPLQIRQPSSAST